MASDPPSQPSAVSDPDDDASTKILRRAPLSTGSTRTGAPTDPPTSILRRHPTGALPVVSEPPDRQPPRAAPISIGPALSASTNPTTAIATTVFSILSGWGTGVIATDLIAGWWETDPLFCVAMGFLTTVSAAASISGVVALLLRRRTARLLIAVGALIAVLIFAGLFLAGATVPAVVYALPVLPLAALALVALPATARWTMSG